MVLESQKFCHYSLTVQLAFAFVACNILFNNAVQMRGRYEDFKDSYSDKVYYRLSDALYSDDAEEEFWKKSDSLYRLKKFYTEISKDQDYSYYEMILQPLYINEFIGPEVSFYNYDFQINVHDSDYVKDGKVFNFIKSILVSYNVISEFNLQLCDGKQLEPQDFIIDHNRKNISVLMGNNLQKYYKIGDEFECIYYGKTFVCDVAGFLQENSAVVIDNVSTNNLVYLDDMIIAPALNCSYDPIGIDETAFQKTLYFMKTTATVSITGEKGIVHFTDKLSGLREKYDIFEFNIISINNDALKLLSLAAEDSVRSMLVLAVVLTVFSLVSIVLVFLLKIYMNTMNYGIYRLVGTPIDIVKLGVVLEACLITVSAYGLAFVINNIIFGNLVKISGYVSIIAAIFVVMGGAFTAVKMDKLTISQMLRRRC